MALNLINIPKSLNKAYLKQSVSRESIDCFKTNLKTLLGHINENESEEHVKNLVMNFLRDTYYKDKYFINTSEKIDLAVYNGNSSAEKVAVICEVKRPINKSEMISADKINVKAFHEIILYYFVERISNNNNEIKHAIITNIYDWYIFDANEFDKTIFRNSKIRQLFDTYINDKKDNRFFYEEIAKIISDSDLELICTQFNLKHFEDALLNNDIDNDNTLIDLYKILSAEHLLKQSFLNDSNSLNKEFYTELLHIIGLEETSVNGKRVIVRKSLEKRNPGSLIENTIAVLQKKILTMNINISSNGEEASEYDLFSSALELCITWLNRILFLKLLEGQLKKYRRNMSYAFLNSKLIIDFDELDELFFEVLAVPVNMRSAAVNQKYTDIPYLNSSLFEASDSEKKLHFTICELKDRFSIPLYSYTVLKDEAGSKISGEMKTLKYLFDFLDAYDFSSDSSAVIQEQNKSMINAAVLGLIFEKLNGYKDGSFFTPGYITMYMCRETIRNIVVNKFNAANNWNCNNFEELKGKIEYTDTNIRKEANLIVNSIKICDPAVGSGHFLVSALNELIAVKNDLKILNEFASNARLRGVIIHIENDELIVEDEESNQLFEYYLSANGNRIDNKQTIQQTLFNEKLALIENCLFGVDINPKSVMICRLRLWIELLKNAYYKDDGNLETLPNIDINIKHGNSLVSRYKPDAVMSFKDIRNMESYKLAVNEYKNVTERISKLEIKKAIELHKNKLKAEIPYIDDDEKKIDLLSGKLQELNQIDLFNADTEKEKAKKEKDAEKISHEIEKLQSGIDKRKEALENGNPFEWRYEFPEVLNSNGNFAGFDLVIGNPPYIQLQTMGYEADILQYMNYSTFIRTADIYCLFFERAAEIAAKDSTIAFITSNKWMRAGYGKSLRFYLSKQFSPHKLIDFAGVKVFDSATVDTNILISYIPKKENVDFFACSMGSDFNNKLSIDDYFESKKIEMKNLDENSWVISSGLDISIKKKIEAKGVPLKEWDISINYGIKTGYNEAFIIDGQKKDELIAKDPKSAEIIKPILRGRDIKRYKAEFADLWLLFIPWHFPLHKCNNITGASEEAENEFKIQYPAIYEHLLKYKEQLEMRNKAETGIRYEWYALQRCANTYHEEFSKEKIVWASVGETYFSFVPINMLLLDTNYFCVFNTSSINKYILGLLNSKLLVYFLNTKDTQIGTIAYRHYKYNIEQLPIPKLSESEQVPYIERAEKILAKKETGEDTSDLEREIDKLVYELYELSEEEIKIVEGNA